MAKPLTVKEIESKKPKDKPYKFAVDRGLYIRVPSNGIKTWLVRYVVDGRQIDYAQPKPYGASGDGFMSLAEAKARNAEIQSLAREGVNYQTQQAELRQDKVDALEQKKTEALTFIDLYLVWLRDGVSRSDGNKYIKQSFSKHAIPVLGTIELRKLTEHHLRGTYRTIIESGKVATAVELSKDIGQMLRWAEKRKPWRVLLIDGNPAELVEVKKLVPKNYTKERKRQLSIEEIQKLKYIFTSMTQLYADAPSKYGIERPLKKEVQIAMWLCLSTLCRVGELLMTEWKHINFEERTWYIPAANTKGEVGDKRDQVVYLSDFSLDQFKQLHKLSGDSLYAFPAQDNKNHVCVKSASKQVGDRQVKFKNRTKEFKSRVESDSLVLGAEEWTPHDLRRTGATIMQKLKIHRDVINLCQNHVIGTKVDRVYLLDEYADEKRDAWQKLGDRIEAILSSENVVSLKVA
jgi:integrase